jgi:hypothetical protein
MKKTLKYLSYLVSQIKDIRPVAAIVAVVILLVAISTQEPLNNDGILYLQSAEAFIRHGWEAAVGVYPWPFYSILIAILSKITHMSFEHAAYMLNIICLVATVTTFITITKELGALHNVQCLAAVIILGHPQFHHYHAYIIRDFGYWAFLLLSLLCFIRYYRQLWWRYALGWGLSINFSILFRLEGVVLSCFIPLVLLLRPGRRIWQKICDTLKAYCVGIVALTVIILVWWFTMDDSWGFAVGRINEIRDQFLHCGMFVVDSLNKKAAIISKFVLLDYSKDFGMIMTICGLAGIYLYKLIATLYPVHTLLCAHALFKNLVPVEAGIRNILISFVALSLLVPAMWLGQKFYLSNRFLIPASLLLLIWSPFSLHSMYRYWREGKKTIAGNRIIFPLFTVIILVMFVYAFLPPKQSKAYIVTAGKWLKQGMPSESKLYTNVPQVSFYASRPYILWDFSKKEYGIPKWTSGDFVVLKVRKKEYEKARRCLSSFRLETVKIFSNKEGDKVVVLRATKPIGPNGLH